MLKIWRETLWKYVSLFKKCNLQVLGGQTGMSHFNALFESIPDTLELKDYADPLTRCTVSIPYTFSTNWAV